MILKDTNGYIYWICIGVGGWMDGWKGEWMKG